MGSIKNVLILTVVSLALLNTVYGKAIVKRSQLIDPGKRYCGKNLGDMMAGLCRGLFDDLINAELMANGNRLRRSINLRPKRGVVEECCDNPCKLSTLKLFCGGLQ